MIGEVDPQDAATLSSGDLSDFDSSVELTIDDDTVTGTAAFPDESVDFTADAVTGDAGVYWARGTEENPDVTGDWVVLSIGSQWGRACLPPYSGPCCHLRR